MKTNKLTILMAAMLMLNGCSLRDTAPDKPEQGDVQPETAETETGSADNEDTVDYEALYKPVLDEFFRFDKYCH